MFRRAYLSRSIEFNDPFDMAARMVAIGTPAQRQARLERRLASNGIFDPQKRDAAMQDLMVRSRAPACISTMSITTRTSAPRQQKLDVETVRGLHQNRSR
jgi:hypothetical protein